MTVKFDKFLYGGDYNPDQWFEYPEILEEDIRLMKKANINTVSLGIFAWAKLEPEEGNYQFDWLEEIVNKLYANGISTIMATPSGARPHWLADKYPEVLQVTEMREKKLFGFRHNHCITSPVFRQKVKELDMALAKRFDKNPAVIMWHISNELGGECHCQLCQQAFRGWLKDKYKTIDEVNRKWNNAFWSHDYDDFDQIESPTPLGEMAVHGLYIDWRRFMSDSYVDFCKWEIDSLREAGATKPATTNMMYNYPLINYQDLAKVVDIVSWDNYPTWHKKDDKYIAMDTAMEHDFMRSLKKAPFVLMESCPGATNWQSVSKLKKPGALEAASLQAVAHGSESVLYFQIRKGRGGFEKFHGAVIDHYGKDDDRTYLECCRVGQDLTEIDEIRTSVTKSEVAVVYDLENRWAMENAAGPRNKGLFYREATLKSYAGFRKQGLNVDVIGMSASLDGYKIVAAPMAYMFRAGFEDKVRAFVENGGTFIMTYWSGVVDQYDLTVLGGTPGGLMDVMGLRSSEIDGLYEGETNSLIPCDSDNEDLFLQDGGFKESYSCQNLCQLVEPTTADVLFVYGEDFYAGTPALTVNSFGQGKAYYVCADAEQSFYDDVYKMIAQEADVCGPLVKVPEGIEVTTRNSENHEYVFIQNFNSKAVKVDIPDGYEIMMMHSAQIDAPGVYTFSDELKDELPAFGTIILKK